MANATSTQIQELYVAYFGRAADPTGLDYWTEKGISTAAFAANMYAQPEFKSAFGSSSVEAQVNQIYKNLFDREADVTGLTYWTQEINLGNLQLAEIATHLIWAAQNNSGSSADKTALSNRADAAVAYTAKVRESTAAILAYQPVSSDPWNPGDNITAAKTYLSGIDGTTAYTAAGIASSVATLTSTGTVATTTFALTTGTDAGSKFTGGANTDAFSAVLVGAAATGSTANPGDSLVGGEGEDSLTISVSGAVDSTGNGSDYTLQAVSTTGIEKILYSNFNTDTNDKHIVDAALMTGVTTFGLSSSGAEGDTTFQNIKALAGAEMRNGSGDLTLTYNADVVTGTADVQTLTVSALTGGTFDAASTETIAIKGELAKSTLAAATSSTLKTVTIDSDQDLTISTALVWAATGNSTTIDGTVDASASTGKITVDASGSVSTVSVTGGSGDDTIKMAGRLTTNDVVDGGAGTDTLTMTAIAASSALDTEFTNVKNIETVAYDAAVVAVALDVSKLSAGVSKIILDVSDNDEDTGAKLASTVTNLGSQTVVIKHTVADEDDSGNDSDGQKYTITGAVDTSADSINVELDAISTDGATLLGVDEVDVSNYETVNLASKKSTTVTLNDLDVLTATSATTLNVTGDADLTIGSISSGALTSIDASALVGKFVATVGSDKIAAKLATKDSTLAFGTSLNNDDSVVGGAGTKDEVTATVTGRDATTGALTMSAVETLTLTTSGDNTLDMSGVTGLKSLVVSANTQTITGYDLPTTTLTATGAATVKLTGADTTGAADTFKFAQKLDGDVDNVIEATGIETIEIEVNDTAATVNVAGFDLDKFEASTVTYTQHADSSTAVSVDQAGTKYHKNVSTVNATGLKGVFTGDATDASGSVTFNVQGAGIQTLTGGSAADTFNIGKTVNVVHVVTGNGGTDTVNITADAGSAFDVSTIAAEKLNITLEAGEDVTSANAVNAGTTDITLAGGNSLSTFTFAAEAIVDTVKTVDGSAFKGNVVFDVIKDVIDDTIVLTGSTVSAKDELNYNQDSTGTDKLYSTGVEILDLDVDATSTLDLTNATGVKTIDIDVAAAKTFTISNLTGSELIKITAGAADSDVTPTLATSSGSSDSISFELNGSIAAGLDLNTSDIETVTIKTTTNAESVDLSGLAMTTAGEVMTLKLTGDTALTASATNADITTIDASGMSTGGSFIQTGRSATAAVTYTGSAGDDTFIMTKSGDVIAAGDGTGDTLDIDLAAILGGLHVDLTAADQVVTFNGSATSGTVTGFENVDASGYTNGSALITGTKAANTLTGTGAVDQIDGGAGADIITGGAGNDTITTGAGADIIHVGASSDGNDTITDFTPGTGGDIFGTAGYEGRTTNDSLFLQMASDGTHDADLNGVTTLNFDVSTAAADMTVGQLNTALGSATISGGTDGSLSIFVVSTDVSASTVDAFVMLATHDGTDFDAIAHLTTLSNVSVTALTDANFGGYASA